MLASIVVSMLIESEIVEEKDVPIVLLYLQVVSTYKKCFIYINGNFGFRQIKPLSRNETLSKSYPIYNSGMEQANKYENECQEFYVSLDFIQEQSSCQNTVGNA